MSQKLIFSNRPALEMRVVDAVRTAITRGVKPETAYRLGRQLLDHVDSLTKPRPYGVRDLGPLVSPYVKLDNLVRELGHAYLVEPKGPSARAEISW